MYCPLRLFKATLEHCATRRSHPSTPSSGNAPLQPQVTYYSRDNRWPDPHRGGDGGRCLSCLLLARRKFHLNLIRRFLTNQGLFGLAYHLGDFYIGASVTAYVMRHDAARVAPALHGKMRNRWAWVDSPGLHHGENERENKTAQMEVAAAAGHASNKPFPTSIPCVAA